MSETLLGLKFNILCMIISFALSNSSAGSFVVFTLAKYLENGSTSIPTEWRLFNKASIFVVPLPENGSNMVSFSFEYFFINHLGNSGKNLAGYLCKPWVSIVWS